MIEVKINKIVYDSSVEAISPDTGVVISTDRLVVKKVMPFTHDLEGGNYTLRANIHSFGENSPVIQFSFISADDNSETLLHQFSIRDYYQNLAAAWLENTKNADIVTSIIKDSDELKHDWADIAEGPASEGSVEALMDRFIADFTVAYVQKDFHDFLDASDTFFERLASDLKRAYLDPSFEQLKLQPLWSPKSDLN